MSISQDIAKARALIIRKNSITYNYNIVLNAEQYTGLAELIFYIDNTNFTELYIDFSPTSVQSIKVNTIDFPIPLDIQNFLIVPRKYLQKGRNYISVLYTNDYDTDGLGCLTFTDNNLNENNLQYVYTQFQPYGANRVFPCFDQPDLKANMKLSVVNSTDWIAVSNQPSTTPAQSFDLAKLKSTNKLLTSSSNQLFDLFSKKVGDNTKMTIFQTTDLLPTYVFGFSAGSFIGIPPSVQNPSVPMTIYALSGSYFLVESYSEFIYDVTQKAMTYFQNFFKVKYPFKKYDQVFLRELDFWAMENAGMVTLSQEHLIKTSATSLDKYNLANTIVHELSHHWFGNYVTMEWWDDLWLNESFAQFMAYYCLQQINDSLLYPLQPPKIYFRDTKYWGYVEDERNTATHPIRGQVADTNVADSIFDGITYNKGAALLNQMLFLVGEAKFVIALNKYFGRFAWSNATILDLLDELAPYFPPAINITIDQWRTDWLQLESLNVFETIWDPTKVSPAEDLTLYQSAYRSTDGNLRSHSLQVAFFDATGAVVESQQVTVNKKSNATIITYDGSKNIAAVLVNYNDYAYIQNYMDHVSLQFFMANINKVTDDSTRCLIWYNISSMVRQTLVSVSDFYTMILVNLFDEKVDFILDQILDQLLSYLKQYTPTDLAIQIRSGIFDKIYDILKNGGLTDANSDRVQILYKQYIDYAITDGQRIQLNYLLQDQDLTNVSSVVQVSDQLCWQIVKAVFSVNSPEFELLDSQKWDIFDYMQGFDGSYRADQAREVCGAILATDMQYDQLYGQLLLPGIDLTTRHLYAEGLTSKYNQQRYNNIYRDRYFADVINPQYYSALSYNQFQLFYTQMKPFDTNYSDQRDRYQVVLDNLSQFPQLAAHCTNIKKIMDDLTMSIENNPFNADTNLALTKIRADQRFLYIKEKSINYISNIAYTDLNGVNSTYQGLTEISFILTTVPKILPIDFAGNQISDLIVNGFNVVSAQIDQFLVIPRVYLKSGLNNIAVNYVNYYNNDGLGCMGYTDSSQTPAAYYTYTQFQPYAAHRFIPCFDQPNLKAPISFNVIVPTGWVSASNNPVVITGTYVEADYVNNAPVHQYPTLLTKYLAGKTGDYYVFQTTEYISTYLYCVISGQYYSIVATPAQQYNQIPMTLYSLQSYSTSLDYMQAFIFQITAKALSFFVTKFGVQYQFKKYDTIFCHEYKFGAMQNPGLITFTDTYLYGDKPQAFSVAKYVRLAVTIAHECAHNWFGDYVTMNWWDDLWLNESFADFISYFCIDNIRTTVADFQGLASAWLSGLERSVGGYREDQITATTHPIRSTVPNTSLALQYFDGITYQKGSMVLKQLMFLIGQANFFKGLNSYFTKYGWGNTTIDDFLGQMRQYFNVQFQLDQWKNAWILTPSLNIITIEWDSTSTSATAPLTINQSNYTDSYDQLRYHSVNIAYFHPDGSITVNKELIKNQPQTIVSYDATNGVSAILVNYDHQDFMKFRFDDVSETYFLNNLSLITDPLTRMVIYFYMNQQVRDGYLEKKVVDYRENILPSLEVQTQDIIFQFELKFLNTATISYLRSDQRQNARTPLFDFVLSSLENFGKYKEKIEKATKLRQNNKPNNKPINSPSKFGSRLAKYPIKKLEQKALSGLTDVANRKTILKDILPLLCDAETITQVDVMKQWLEGTYVPLINSVISASQGWEVVKLIYASSHYDSVQKDTAYALHSGKYPGIIAELIKNTCLTLVAADTELIRIYNQVFKAQVQSITVKTYIALGWNNAVHSAILLNTFKPQIFADITDLSKTLTSEHFMFFYTKLQPIDDDLQTTIDNYKNIKLVGSDMIGNINNIKKIVSDLELRKNLYLINNP